MIDNIYLESILKPWSTLDRVTSIDKLSQLKKIDSFPTSFIVNTQAYPEDGHWILLIFSSPLRCIFFDPLGPSPSIEKEEIKDFIKKNSMSLEINLNSFQSYFSYHCGFFCVAKIISHMLDESHLSFSNHFSTNLPDNDEIVIKLIKSFSFDLLK